MPVVASGRDSLLARPPGPLAHGPVCAIIGGLVTDRKGRGTWPGAALGLLLGLIGVLVAVLLPRRPA